nr:polyphosphate polymerase domain-containing protein [Bacteroidota bacterium]
MKDTFTVGNTLFQTEFNSVLQGFLPISLESMSNVKLLDRFDKKFIFHVSRLATILALAQKHYRILTIDTHKVFEYSTQYYDTLLRGMYLAHHNRKLNRFKVRKREYLTTHQVFFEIKIKNNKGRTRKKRIEITNSSPVLCKAEKQFLKKHTFLTSKMIYPVLKNEFLRVTLVHNAFPERITMDFNLRFLSNDRVTEIPYLGIAEIKEDASSGTSDLEKIMRSLDIFPTKFSKYCMGSVLLDNTL